MKITIDRGGRVVIPKRLRDRLMLRPGDQLEVEELEGRIEITPVTRDVSLVETRHGLLAAADGSDPPVGPDEVRELLERTRR